MLVHQFFDKLSLRLRRENHLSDITWALCESNPEFRNFFLAFFWSDISIPNIRAFKREHSEVDCRPDFFIRTDGQDYLIEVKIYDRNDHLEQYTARFPNVKIGYISNYAMPAGSAMEFRTWEQFDSYLDDVSEHFGEESGKLVAGYRRYLKSVCSLIKFRKMNLSGLSDLYHFNKLIVKIVKSVDSIYEIAEYAQAKSRFVNRSGATFSMRPNEGGDTIYPWIGVWYDESSVGICWAIGKGGCNPRLYESLLRIEGDGISYVKPYEDDSNVWIEMKGEVFAKVCESEVSLDEQIRLISTYISDVMAMINRILKQI